SSRVAAACFATLLAAESAGAQAHAVPGLGDYAVLAMNGVTLRRGVRVASGAVGSVSGTVRLGDQARVSNIVAAPTLRLGLGSRAGTVFCHLVSGPPTLPTCNALTDPLVDPALIMPVAVTPGVMAFHLPPHTGTAPLPAGTFADVRVGRGSVLEL